MAAPENNTNAKGNSGGRPYSKENREKAATLKGMALDWMIKIMKSKAKKNELLKEKIVLKIATTCIPQEIKHSGNEDDSTPIPILNILEKCNARNKKPIHKDNSDPKDNGDVSENKDSSGWNECVKDNINPPILNSSSSVGQEVNSN